MENKAAIEKLRDDEHYYGGFGKRYFCLLYTSDAADEG